MSMRKMDLGETLYAVVVNLYGGTPFERESTMGPYTDLAIAKRFRTQENKRIANNVATAKEYLKKGPPATGFYGNPRRQAEWVQAQEKWANGSHRAEIFICTPTWSHTNL